PFFYRTAPATPAIYPLSLHDALPISLERRSSACHSSAHGPHRPALPSPDIAGRSRVHRIPPRVRDVRNAPLWDRTVIDIEVIWVDRKSTRLNSSHVSISYAVFCLKKK